MRQVNYEKNNDPTLKFTSLKRLGIDEISLVKEQEKFIVVLVDLNQGKLIGLVSEKK